MLHREPEPDVLDECARLGLGFLPFFPLESGLLTGKIRQGQPVPEGTRLSNADTQKRFMDDQRLATVEKLIAFAEGHGHTMLDLAFSWLLARPVVASVIAGATKPEQIHANAGAVGWQLSAADLAEIDALLA
jgi:aryl-alcohol dehydrogenase-like predicted oxidoreductase